MGNVQWNRTYEYQFYDFLEVKEGGYLFSTGRHLFKTDWFGDVEWIAFFEGLGASGISSLLQVDDGGFVFTGLTGSSYHPTRIWLVKTGAAADVTPLWFPCCLQRITRGRAATLA